MLTDSSALGTQPGLSKEQKIGFILLLFFAFFTIGLGILQIRNTMLAPFALNNKITVAIKDQVNTLEALRYRDTDHDELNDFDELYIYGTSPYLYDTFSYGLSDKEVIAKGLPLCPKGQECVAPTVSGEGQPTAIVGNPALADLKAEAEKLTPPPDVLQSLRDPKSARQLLVDSGADKRLLDQLSDADLAIMLNQILSDTSTLQSLQAISALATSTKR